MKKLILISLSFLIFSCGNSEELRKNNIKHREDEVHIIIKEVDSCEYILSISGRTDVIIHKNNCKFCAKRLKNGK